MKNVTRPVGAFLTDEEFKQFEKAAEHTGQMIGEAARFALNHWARVVLGVQNEADSNDGYSRTGRQEEAHP